MTDDGQKPQLPKPDEKPDAASTPNPAPAQTVVTVKDTAAAKGAADEKDAAAHTPAAKSAPPGDAPAASADKPANGDSPAGPAKPAAEAPTPDAPPEPQPLSERPPPPPPVEASSIPARREVKSIQPADAHVLVVEDNVPNFMLIARLLAFLGVQRCEWKTSGWQVVEFADTLPRIDLILMDIRLPYEDGFQALERVRANDRLKDTLVVAVTAEASVEQMKRAREAGFDGFLGKPLDPDRFPEQVRRVLRGEPVWEIH